VLGLVDEPGQRFVFSLWDAGQIWIADMSDPAAPRLQKFSDIGRNPYDAFITADGRYYLAGLFGEAGLALLDLWHPEQGVRRILGDYGRGEAKLPVYKMPHLEGWAVAGTQAFVPAIGRHEVLVIDMLNWQQVGRIAVHGQPVFVMARPDGRQVWVSVRDADQLQVYDTETFERLAVLPASKPSGIFMTARAHRIGL
jgi:protein NirF